MSESKIQLNERKIRNGARRGVIKGERTMRYKTWKKLSTSPVPTFIQESTSTYKITRTPGKEVWYCPAELPGETL